MSKFRTAFNLLIPSQCSLCKRHGWTLCETCLDDLQPFGHPAIRKDLSGFSITSYADSMPELISSFKEQGITELASRLISKFDLGQLVDALTRSIDSNQTLFLVPVPSSATAMRTRGFNPAEQVAVALRNRLLAVAREFAESRLPQQIRVARVLERKLVIADQASLNLTGRWLNQAGSMQVRHSVAGMSCLLVDDIVTTGATLLEARKTLEEHGASVVGFFTLAETFLNRATQN